MRRYGKELSPKKDGGRTQTVTLRATREDVARIDRLAAKNGLCRAYFVLKCANAGYVALCESGEMK